MNENITNSEVRELFEKSGFGYEVLTRENADSLRGFLADELKTYKNDIFTMTVARDRKKDFVQGVTFFIEVKGYIDDGRKFVHFKRREAISFNCDGFIGFAGWADSTNVQPILRAFVRWLDSLEKIRNSVESYYLQYSNSTVGSNVLWWGKNGNGYVTDLSKAHIYTREEAISHHESRITDIPWPKEYVDSKTRETVDTQYLKPEEAKNFNVDDTSEFVLIEDNYDGNDVYFATENYMHPTELKFAKKLQFGSLLKDMIGERREVWPFDYVESFKRPTVSIKSLKLKKAHEKTGIVIAKKRKYVQKFNCGGCGRFISISDYYSNGVCDPCAVHCGR